VLSKTSFDKYNIVDVQYTGQVIGSKTRMSKVDSMQLKKNIEKLLQEARKMQTDSTASIPANVKENISTDRTAESKSTTVEQTNSVPLKTTTTAKPKIIEEKPKAAMPANDR
jgi:cell division protein FtsQ